MAGISDNISDWQLSETELAQSLTVKYISTNAGSMPLYIPKLMPLIGYIPGKPHQLVPKRMTLNTNCFLNAQACKPAISKMINYQEYIIVPLYPNRNFSNPKLYAGSQIQIEVLDKNPDTMYISNKIDHSVD